MIKVGIVYMPHFAGDELSLKYKGDSGFDLPASIDKDIEIQAHTHALIPTGLRFDIPKGYEIQIRSRSGLANKNGVFVLNSPATIDSEYIGELFVVLASFESAFIVSRGMRIAQAVFQKVPEISFVKLDDIKEKERGNNGLGSSGV